VPDSRPSCSKRFLSARAVRFDRSTNTTPSAPREYASRPKAPVPANRSSTRSPSTLPSAEKRDSRTRSVVGRTPSGTFPSDLPPNDPLMIRNELSRRLPRRLTPATSISHRRPEHVACQSRTDRVRDDLAKNDPDALLRNAVDRRPDSNQAFHFRAAHHMIVESTLREFAATRRKIGLPVGIPIYRLRAFQATL